HLTYASTSFRCTASNSRSMVSNSTLIVCLLFRVPQCSQEYCLSAGLDHLTPRNHSLVPVAGRIGQTSTDECSGSGQIRKAESRIREMGSKTLWDAAYCANIRGCIIFRVLLH